jgi:hypothetical protein
LSSQNDVYKQDCFLTSATKGFQRIESGGGKISANLDKGKTGKGLRLDYEVANEPHNYSGWQVLLGDANNSGINLSSYTSLTFSIRGENGGETPNIWLMMPIIDGQFNRYYKRLELTSSWDTISIPLQYFTSSTKEGERVDLQKIRRIQFMFEWHAQPTLGRVYIDDLCIE